MAVAATVSIQMAAESAKLRADLDKLQKDVNRIDGASTKLSKSLRGVGNALAGAFSIGAVSVFTASVIRATAEQQKAFAQLQAAVQSTGGVAGFTAEQLAEMAGGLQQVSTFGDEAVIAMQSVLLTFTQVRGPVFQDAQQAILDVSTRLGRDLTSSALQVGKALNDPIKGVSALAEAGIQFTAAQKETIKALVEGGQVADAQRIILKELEVQFGGSAAAARNTLGGALAGVKNAFGDLLEAKSGTPAVTASLNNLATVLADPATKAAADNLLVGLSTAAVAAVEGIANLTTGVRDLGEELAARRFGAAIDDLGRLNEELALRRDQLAGRASRVRFFGKEGWVEWWDDAELNSEIQRLQQLIEASFPQSAASKAATRQGPLAPPAVEAVTSAAASTAAVLSAQQRRLERDAQASPLDGDTFGAFRSPVEVAQEVANQEIQIATDRAAKLYDIERGLTDFRLSAAGQVTDAIFGNAQAQMAIEEAKTQTFASLAQQAAASGILFGSRAAKVAQGLAAAETVYNTGVAVMRAWKDVPWPLNIAAAAKVALAGAAQLAMIKRTQPGTSATIAPGGGGGAPGYTPAVPETVGEREFQPRNQAQIIVQGHIFSTRESAQWFIDQVRDAINDSDVTIIGPGSRQALELAGAGA